MECSTAFVIFAVLALLIVAFLGGKLTIKQDALEIDTKGFLDWLIKARQAKSAPAEPGPQFKPRPAKRRKLPRASLLWVDDKPINNLFERHALASIGLHSDTYTTNDEALKGLHLVSYDLVISDIGRGQALEDGWQFLKLVRETYPTLPFMFYTGVVDDSLRQRAMEQGAKGITDRPDDLIRLVIDQTSKP